MQVQPYLMFNGRCDEALALYRSALGAEVEMVARFRDAPDPSMVGPGMGDKVMHATLRFGGTTVFASDGGCTGAATFAGFTLTATVADDAEADRVFAALAADGGSVRMPLARTFWSSRFGMLTDKFGVGWQVMVGP